MEIGANYVVKTQKHAKQKKKNRLPNFSSKKYEIYYIFLKNCPFCIL